MNEAEATVLLNDFIQNLRDKRTLSELAKSQTETFQRETDLFPFQTTSACGCTLTAEIISWPAETIL